MYIFFDIGGTKTRIAASNDCLSFGEPIKIDTPKDFNAGIEEFKRIATDLSGGERIEYAGGGVAGPLDKDHSKLLNSPNLPGWIEKPLKEELEKALGASVVLQNDTAVVGLGEAHHGAGKGDEIVVYITVSTGVGGVRIVNGFIDKGRFGFEPGHQVIDMDGGVCPECNVSKSHPDGVGHLEGYVSGTATANRFGKKAYEIDQSDPVWDELAYFLAVGLNNTIVHWSPDIVVLGGSMMVGDPAIPLDKVMEYLKKELKIFPEHPILKKAELKDEGGLYGAMVLVDQNRDK
jgi:predicted NBD/HSP70 family sugar kinase